MQYGRFFRVDFIELSSDSNTRPIEGYEALH